MNDAGHVIDGRYTIIRRLGVGGMAEVFLARDGVLGREAAIKVLQPGLAADPSFVERFKREAQAAAALSHPNVVAVYNSGAYEGTYYIVMEYVPGENLRDRVRREGHLPEADALEIAAQVADALAAAHAIGLIHRDVKPANILLRPNGRVQVTDFGIARAAGDSPLTATNLVMGTAHYLAPEQVLHRPLDGRADLYALGCVLFEMLTGGAPFAAESLVAVAYKQAHELPPSVRDLRPEVSAPTVALLTTALAKSPIDRFPDADAMRDALRESRRRLVAAGEGTVSLPHAEPPGIPAASVVTTTTVQEVVRPGVSVAVSPPVVAHALPVAVTSASPPVVAPKRANRRGLLVALPVALLLLLLLIGGLVASRFAGSGSTAATVPPGTAIAVVLPSATPIVASPTVTVPVIVPVRPTLTATPAPAPPILVPATATLPPLPTSTPLPTAVMLPTATLPPADAEPPVLAQQPAAMPEPPPTPIPATPTPLAPVPPPTAFVPPMSTPLPAPPLPTPTPLAPLPTPVPPTAVPVPPTPIPLPPTMPPPPPTAVPVPPTATPVRPTTTPIPPTATPARPTVAPSRNEDAAPAVGAANPTQAVSAFYQLVNQRRYDEAAALWSPRQRANFPPVENINGRFRDTRQITAQNVQIFSMSGNNATVSVVLVETRNDGSVQRLMGAWNLVRVQGVWLLDAPMF